MTRICIIVLFLMCSFSVLHSEDQMQKEIPITTDEKTDGFIKILSFCGNNNPCMIAKSVFLFPVFPWFQYPYDDVATNFQYKKFNRYSANLDLMLSKQNYSFSGYNMNLSVFKKWFGVDLFYEILNNSDIDQKTIAPHFIFRFMPRKHIQPYFAIGWRFVSTYKTSGNGFELSFFNYKIMFNRFFNLFVINYITWINNYKLIHGIFGFEYYIYPTISIKSLFEIKYQFAQLLHGVTFGISLQM